MVDTDTDTGSTDCKKPYSCIDMFFLPPIATEEVPSVARFTPYSPGGNDVAQSSPCRMRHSVHIHITVAQLQATHRAHVW